MSLTPIELRHVKLATRPVGYDRASCDRLLQSAAESLDEVWRERDELRQRTVDLEGALAAQRAEVDGLRAALERHMPGPASVDVDAHRESGVRDELLRETLTAAQGAAAQLRDELHSRAGESVGSTRVPPEDDEALAEIVRRRNELEADVRSLEARHEELLENYRILLASAVELVEDEPPRRDGWNDSGVPVETSDESRARSQA